MQRFDFAAPLGSVTCGRLHVARGAAHLTIRGDSVMADLYRFQFTGREPRVQVRDGAITLRLRRELLVERGFGEVMLNQTIPWQLEVDDGASGLILELPDVRLDALVVSGGARQLTATLSAPVGSVPIRFSGGIEDITIRRPAQTGVRIFVRDGGNNLRLDTEHIARVDDAWSWESPNAHDASRRYEIAISGGVSRLHVDSY